MPRKKREKEQSKCLMPDCDRNGDGARGLCISCYNTSRRAVAKGETTWRKLERANLARKPHSVPRAPASKAIENLK